MAGGFDAVLQDAKHFRVHFCEITLDEREIDRGLEHDTRQVAEMAGLIRVEVHQHEMLETCDRRFDSKNGGGFPFGDDSAFALRPCDRPAPRALSVAHDVAPPGLAL